MSATLAPSKVANHTSAPPTNKGQKFPPEPLDLDEVRALVGAASGRSSSGIRMRALIAVMFGSGLRLAETLALFPRDVDLDKGIVRVRNGKGSKSRTVGLDPYACGLVAVWMTRRTALGLTGRHPIFAVYSKGRVGKPMVGRDVRSALARLARKAGIDKRVHPHGLRHSLAFDLAESGVPVHAIKVQLGHSNVAVTSRYIDHLRPGDVIQTMQQRDWG